MSIAAPQRAVLAALLALTMALGLLVSIPTSAEATTFSVTRSDDPAPGTAGQCGSPASDDSDDCSLRQAIRRANATPGPDTVVLAATTYTLTQVGAGEDAAETGDLDVTDDLTISGAGTAGTIVTGAGLATPDRLLHVIGGASLAVVDLTLTEGETNALGGALRNDGGDVALTRTQVTNNSDTSDGGGAIANLNGTLSIAASVLAGNDTAGFYGGAVFNFATDDGGPVTATMTIADTRLEDNTSGAYGGAIATEAELTSTAELVIDRSVLTGNRADSCCGGAIIADDGEYGAGGADARTKVVIRDSQLVGNEVDNCCGGAIYAEGTTGTADPTVTVRIERSSLDANSSAGALPGDGCCGGALYLQDADLVAVDTSFDDNVDDTCCGGAVYLSDSTATFTRVTMDRNQSFRATVGTDEGACCGGAAGIYDSTVTFTDSQVIGNVTGEDCCGGAFEIGRSDVTFLRTTIADNDASGCCGGAMEVYGGSTVRVLDSTVSGNRELTGEDGDPYHNDGGGGIVTYNDTDVVEVVNSTISGNSTAETGGGLAILRGTATVVHSTITGNTADVGGTALVAGDTLAGGAAGSITVVDSIVDGTCAVGTTASITSGGGNVTTDAACGFGQASDQTVSDVRLAPLADNGGPTMTHLLLPDSPALDAATAATPDPVGTDQRGVTRPREGDGTAPAVADAGAVEMMFADLSLAKSVDDDTVVVGDEVTYTLAVSNDGPDAADAVVTDVLPDGVTFVSASAGCTEADGTVTCDLGEVDAGTVTATITVRVDAAGTITNDASVAAVAPATDPDASDDAASVDVSAMPTGPTDPDPTGPQRPLEGGVTRIAGADRIATAVEVSRATYPAGAAGAVVLARSDSYPDALAGTPLAVQEDGPLLLTPTADLDERTAAELRRVLPSGGTVYVLGGTAALDPAVEVAVAGLGFRTVRLAGETRYATAVEIATRGLDGFDDVLLVTGTNFPDAVAAGAAAAALDGAVLLTEGTAMPDATSAFLATRSGGTTYAIGGPAAAAAPEAVGIVGRTRVHTAAAVARQLFDAPPVVGVATSETFPDALTGGAQVGAYGGPMLLTDPSTLSGPVARYLDDVAGDTTVYVYGGSHALDDDVVSAIVRTAG